MPFRLPHLQQQFIPRDATSPDDCTAAAAATAADADSRGALTYTHAQVRAASNEPHPDPSSPGLNLQQVDAALFHLSGGRVDLDVHGWNGGAGSPWSGVPGALRAGRWAVLSLWRGVLVDAGLGGTSKFRGAHATVYGYDQNKGKFILGDPLIPHWLEVSTTVAQQACRELLIRKGVGAGAAGAYYALTRDVYDAPAATLSYSAVFTPGPFWYYPTADPGVIRQRERFAHITSAPCEAPTVVHTTRYGDRKLSRISKGALAGGLVEGGSTNVVIRVKTR